MRSATSNATTLRRGGAGASDFGAAGRPRNSTATHGSVMAAASTKGTGSPSGSVSPPTSGPSSQPAYMQALSSANERVRSTWPCRSATIARATAVLLSTSPVPKRASANSG